MSRGRARRRAEARLLGQLELAFGRWPRAFSPALPWRWRYELTLTVGLPAVIVIAIHLLGPGPGLVCLSLLAFGLGLWPPGRAALVARAWCVITPHRVRVGCVQAGIFSRNGRLPVILWTSARSYGERLLIWCTAGTSAEDFQSARTILRAACWAADVRVERSARYAHLITLDVIRYPARAPS